MSCRIYSSHIDTMCVYDKEDHECIEHLSKHIGAAQKIVLCNAISHIVTLRFANVTSCDSIFFPPLTAQHTFYSYHIFFRVPCFSWTSSHTPSCIYIHIFISRTLALTRQCRLQYFQHQYQAINHWLSPRYKFISQRFSSALFLPSRCLHFSAAARMETFFRS